MTDDRGSWFSERADSKPLTSRASKHLMESNDGRARLSFCDTDEDRAVQPCMFAVVWRFELRSGPEVVVRWRNGFAARKSIDDLLRPMSHTFVGDHDQDPIVGLERVTCFYYEHSISSHELPISTA